MQAIKNSKIVVINKIKVSFSAPEDLIIHKIFAQRPRDIEDIKSILLKNKVNLKYIKKWLLQFEKTFPERKFYQTFVDVLKNNIT